MPPAVTETGEQRRTQGGRFVYECDCCGKLEPWGEAWAWYGSYRQAEDYGMKGVAPVKTICSPECRIQLVAFGGLPAEGIDDKGNVTEDAEAFPRRKRQ